MLESGRDSIEYQERVVALIDVLGFSDLVRQSDKNQENLIRINRLLDTNKLFDRFVGEFLDFADATFFSDSFILSMQNPEHYVLYVVREIGYFCRRLLLQGFPCRGAITVGSLYHRRQFVVGPAFVAAHQLEQSVAVYPRIILDNAAMDLWRQEFRLDDCGSNGAHPQIETLVKRDHDGQHFLDIFHPNWPKFIPPTDVIPSSEPVPTDPVEFLRQAWQRIETGRAENNGNAKVLAKYEWLATECAERATALGVRL